MKSCLDLYLKAPLAFGHFVLAAFALVQVVSLDLNVLRAYGQPVSCVLATRIERAKSRMIWWLAGLWISGLSLVAYGAWVQPGYLTNEKLWCKLIVVVALSVNGFLVHWLGKQVEVDRAFVDLPRGTAICLCIAGAVSSTSWIWACFLGTARTWNNALSWQYIGCLYVAMLLLAMALAAAWHHVHASWHRERALD